MAAIRQCFVIVPASRLVQRPTYFRQFLNGSMLLALCAVNVLVSVVTVLLLLGFAISLIRIPIHVAPRERYDVNAKLMHLHLGQMRITFYIVK